MVKGSYARSCGGGKRWVQAGSLAKVGDKLEGKNYHVEPTRSRSRTGVKYGAQMKCACERPAAGEGCFGADARSRVAVRRCSSREAGGSGSTVE